MGVGWMVVKRVVPYSSSAYRSEFASSSMTSLRRVVPYGMLIRHHRRRLEVMRPRAERYSDLHYQEPVEAIEVPNDTATVEPYLTSRINGVPKRKDLFEGSSTYMIDAGRSNILNRNMLKSMTKGMLKRYGNH
jgi:hypothetical protein